MPALLLYLLQVNVGLVLFHGAYQLVLRQTTFYRLNRWFLLVGVLLSSLYPWMDVSSLLNEKKAFHQTLQRMTPAWQFPKAPAAEAPGFEIWMLLVLLFWLGVGVMAVRFGVQLASLYSLHRPAARASYYGITYRAVQAQVAPFSFWRCIYFNPQQHPQQDWLPILRHEQTHVREWHTLDILLMELVTLFNWFNPAVWLLRNALKQNLEFLTDQQTLEAGINRKQYQFSLLHTTGATPLSFTSSFSFPSLKHRIMMMNKAPSARAQKLRYLAVLPLLFTGLLACQEMAGSSPELSEIMAQGKPIRQSSEVDYDTFMANNPTISRMGWNQDSLFVHLKSGKTETYATTRQGLAAAEKKYGTLPSPPPPPPAPPAAPEAALAPPPPPPPFNVDLPQEFRKRNPTVQGLSASEGSLYVVFTSGEVESFDMTASGVAAFEKKYGTLPPPPPPRKKKDK